MDESKRDWMIYLICNAIIYAFMVCCIVFSCLHSWMMWIFLGLEYSALIAYLTWLVVDLYRSKKKQLKEQQNHEIEIIDL